MNTDSRNIGSKAEKIIFQNAATAVAVGTPLYVGGLKTLTFEITVGGTAPTFTVQFEGAGDSGTYQTINVTNLGTDARVSTATAIGLFRVDMTGLTSFRVNLTAIGGTSPTVTAQGKIVA